PSFSFVSFASALRDFPSFPTRRSSDLSGFRDSYCPVRYRARQSPPCGCDGLVAGDFFPTHSRVVVVPLARLVSAGWSASVTTDCGELRVAPRHSTYGLAQPGGFRPALRGGEFETHAPVDWFSHVGRQRFRIFDGLPRDVGVHGPGH